MPGSLAAGTPDAISFGYEFDSVNRMIRHFGDEGLIQTLDRV